MNTERAENDGASPTRRPSRGAVASVAAAVLVLGGGGAYLATAHAGPESSDSGVPRAGEDSGTPPRLALEGYGTAPGDRPDDGKDDGDGNGHGIAPGEPNPYGVTYRATGDLPDGPSSAPVHRVRGEVTRAEVTRLAHALGLDGTPRVDGTAWTVSEAESGAGKGKKEGKGDGAGPSLRVDRAGAGSWTFSRDSGGGSGRSGGSGGSGGSGPVSEAVAKRAAVPVLKAAGQDGAKLDARQIMGDGRVVNADPVIGGLPTYGWTTGLTVGPQGDVIAGNGSLKTPVKGDTYPVMNARETLDHLNSPSSGRSSGSAKGGTATVERAVFGLASYLEDGRPVLVPSWLFEVRPQGATRTVTLTQPAVEPAYLTSAAGPAPRPRPSDDEPSKNRTRDVRVTGYQTHDSRLTVAFTGGVCGTYSVSAVERPDRVEVRVTETYDPRQICIALAKFFHRTVPLDTPLGDREVVGKDGKEIPLERPVVMRPPR